MTAHNPTDKPAALNAVDSGSESERPQAEAGEKPRDSEQKPPHRGVRGPRSLRRSRGGDRSTDGAGDTPKHAGSAREDREQKFKDNRDPQRHTQKTDKAHVLDLLIVKAHASLIHVLRRLMQTQFLVLLLPMPTIHRSLVTKPGLVRRHAINDLYGVI